MLLGRQHRRDSIAAAQRAEQERLKRKQEQLVQNSVISTQMKVDLGLSVCWAGWNIGAASPEEYGEYYPWGETVSKSDYSSTPVGYNTYHTHFLFFSNEKYNMNTYERTFSFGVRPVCE